MPDLSTEDQLRELQKEIQERALRLSDLEVIIQDYHRERQQLLDELVALKQEFWDLVASQDTGEQSKD